MRRVKYLNNRDLLIEIHKSKNTFNSFIQDDCSTFDIIVPSLSKINVRTIALAKKNKAKKLTQLAWETAKIGGQKKIKLTDFTISPRKIDKLDLVFRVMMFDHVPKDAKRKRNPKTVADHHVKCNFPPFQHYKLDKKGKLICVGKSHWVGGMSNGHFNCHHGQITTNLAKMYMKLCERYGTRANWRGYTYNDEMQSQALMQLSQIGLQFDESKSENPFAYYTAAITNSFTRILNIEKKNQNIRDDLLEQEHMMPSFTRQTQNQTSSPTYKKYIADMHGPVTVATKSSIKELNRKLKKELKNKKNNKNDDETMINHDDHALLKYRKLKEGERKPLVKRDFSVKRVFGKVKKY
jgi:hypothetical protein